MNSTSPDLEMCDIHTQILLDHHAWIQKADELMEAAKLLAPAVRTAWDAGGGDHIKDVQCMLVAFALENLIKAHIIKNQSSRVSAELAAWQAKNKPKDRPCIFNHDINELIEIAEITEFSQPEWTSLFDRLTHLATWSARYPVSTKPSGLEMPSRETLGAKMKGYIVIGLRAEVDCDNIFRAARVLRKKFIERVEPSAGPYVSPAGSPSGQP